jgi:protein mago nashi
VSTALNREPNPIQTKNQQLRYTNQSKYRGEEAIRKRLYVSPAVLEEISRIVRAARVTALDDAQWPAPYRDCRQELEVRLVPPRTGPTNETPPVEHVSLATAKLASTVQVLRCGGDLEGLKRFFFLCQDLKALFLALVAAHFQVQPI